MARKATPKLVESPWFDLDKAEAGTEVEALVEQYKKEQGGRRTAYVSALELYEGRRLGGYTAHSYAMAQGAADRDIMWEADRLRLVRSATESAVANVYAPQKPKPQFQTLGSTWAMRRKAYRLDRICEGILNQRQGRFINVWSFMLHAALDAPLHGMAAVKVEGDKLKKRITHRKVLVPDLFVDPAEGDDPQNLFERAPIDQYTALKRYPHAKQAIKSAKAYEWFGIAKSQAPRANKIIEIKYAWRLPFDSETPGRYVAVINGTVVEDREWTAPSFPFVFLHWSPHRIGFFGSGLADEGGDLARDTGDLDLRLATRARLAAGKKVYYQKESVNQADLEQNDAVVNVGYEAGAPVPVETNSVPFSPMELDYLKFKVENFWDCLGLSQVSAGARREQNITSSVGQITVNEMKAGRQLPKSQRYEQSYVDLAHQYVWRLRELAEDDPEFAVTWPGKNMLRSIKLADADPGDDDMFSVSVAPASALPHDPAGRQQMVDSLWKSGFISQETAKSLIGWPDLDAELNVENAEYEYIDMLIERYLDADKADWGGGDYQAPQGFIMNKRGALRRFASAWFRAKIDQLSLPVEEREKAEFNCKLLERYIKELDALLVAETPAPAAPGGAAPVPPDALPPAPPLAIAG